MSRSSFQPTGTCLASRAARVARFVGSLAIIVVIALCTSCAEAGVILADEFTSAATMSAERGTPTYDPSALDSDEEESVCESSADGTLPAGGAGTAGGSLGATSASAFALFFVCTAVRDHELCSRLSAERARAIPPSPSFDRLRPPRYDR